MPLPRRLKQQAPAQLFMISVRPPEAHILPDCGLQLRPSEQVVLWVRHRLGQQLQGRVGHRGAVVASGQRPSAGWAASVQDEQVAPHPPARCKSCSSAFWRLLAEQALACIFGGVEGITLACMACRTSRAHSSVCSTGAAGQQVRLGGPVRWPALPASQKPRDRIAPAPAAGERRPPPERGLLEAGACICIRLPLPPLGSQRRASRPRPRQSGAPGLRGRTAAGCSRRGRSSPPRSPAPTHAQQQSGECLCGRWVVGWRGRGGGRGRRAPCAGHVRAGERVGRRVGKWAGGQVPSPCPRWG